MIIKKYILVLPIILILQFIKMNAFTYLKIHPRAGPCARRVNWSDRAGPPTRPPSSSCRQPDDSRSTREQGLAKWAACAGGVAPRADSTDCRHGSAEDTRLQAQMSEGVDPSESSRETMAEGAGTAPTMSARLTLLRVPRPDGCFSTGGRGPRRSSRPQRWQGATTNPIECRPPGYAAA
jgi:hypothetical protein